MSKAFVYFLEHADGSYYTGSKVYLNSREIYDLGVEVMERNR